MPKETTAIANNYKRDAPRHSRNPFVGKGVQPVLHAPDFTIARTERLLDVDTGQQAKPMPLIGHARPVPEEAFRAAYVQQLGASLGLGRSASKVLRYILDHVREEDYTVILNSLLVCDQENLSRTPYEQGINILLYRQAIAKSAITNLYFVNPVIAWPQDRFTVCEQYVRRAPRSSQG